MIDLIFYLCDIEDEFQYNCIIKSTSFDYLVKREISINQNEKSLNIEYCRSDNKFGPWAFIIYFESGACYAKDLENCVLYLNDGSRKILTANNIQNTENYKPGIQEMVSLLKEYLRAL